MYCHNMQDLTAGWKTDSGTNYIMFGSMPGSIVKINFTVSIQKRFVVLQKYFVC